MVAVSLCVADSIVAVLVEVSGGKVLLSLLSSIIIFSIVDISSPCTAVGVSLHEGVVTGGSSLVPLCKDTVALVVYAHSVNLKYEPKT